ncbi:MAG TPA: DUF1501 domain-containing protein [Pirellulales bacterium]|jgi:hypothetical protein|nr:DUF1501 domain-containing protein [Pirellulales bacterium]
MAGPSQRAISRRQLLHVGGIGALGLTLPELLHAGSLKSASRTGTAERSCIFIVQYGGASHIDSLDPKPHAPEDIRGPYRPIATRAAGVQVGELLPKLALLADRFALVRSMTHSNGGHDGGMHVAMTGHTMPEADTPYFGSVVARLRPSTRNMPSYVWLQNLAGDVQPRYLAGGFLGQAYSPLRVATDLDNPSAPEFRFTAFDPTAGTTSEGLAARQELLRRLNGSADGPPGDPPAFHRFQEKAFELVAGTEARQAFDLAREPETLRDRYGRHPLGQNLLMARRLVEAGVRLVSVTAWCGVAEGEKFANVQTWDMHGPVAAHIGSIFGTGSYGLGFALPRVDQSVSALLEDLADRGLSDNTLVVMVGEFGRSPKVSNQGRDHWPACYSALLAGGGVRGGLVYGASDKQGAYAADKPVSPENFGATLYRALGIDPATRLGFDGFTRPASVGQPIEDLLV